MKPPTLPRLPLLLRTIERHRAIAAELLAAIDAQELQLARLLRKGVPGELIDQAEDAIDRLRVKLVSNDVALMVAVTQARVINDNGRKQLYLADVFRSMPVPAHVGLPGHYARTLGVAA